MARQSKLTPEQWATVKARWEGCDKVGFEWLSREIEAAWGVQVLRKSLDQMAKLKAWEKGGPASEPIPVEPQRNIPADTGNIPAKESGKVLALVRGGKPTQKGGKSGGNVPPKDKPEVASEVVPPDEPKAPIKPLSTRLRGSVGRPAKYDEAFVEGILDHFDVDPYSDVDVEQFNGAVKRQRMATDPPTLAGYAKSIGVSVDTLGRWATAVKDDGGARYPEFAEAYARARELHEALIVRGGLLGMYEPKTVNSALKNLHGWQDQPARKVAVASVSREELDRRFGDRMVASRARMQALLEERADLLGPDGAGSD